MLPDLFYEYFFLFGVFLKKNANFQEKARSHQQQVKSQVFSTRFNKKSMDFAAEQAEKLSWVRNLGTR